MKTNINIKAREVYAKHLKDVKAYLERKEQLNLSKIEPKLIIINNKSALMLGGSDTSYSINN